MWTPACHAGVGEFNSRMRRRLLSADAMCPPETGILQEGDFCSIAQRKSSGLLDRRLGIRLPLEQLLDTELTGVVTTQGCCR